MDCETMDGEMDEKKWTDDERDEAFDRGMETMQRVALELYRRGREPLLEELETVKRERDEWRDKFHALNQTTGELCETCGWAFKIPGEQCRCEVVKERDEARAKLDAEYLRNADAFRLAREQTEHWKRRAEDAFERGAEAMREACLGVVERFMDFGSPHPGMIAHKISALPTPEEP